MILLKATTGWIFFFALLQLNAGAQYTLHLVALAPSKTKEVYVTGSFNNWDPGNRNCKLKYIANDSSEIVLKNIKAGEFRFKFTRGNVTSIECSSTGTNINPRLIKILHDTTVYVAIAAWSDGYFDLNHLSDSMLYEAMMARAGYYVEINLDSSYQYALQLYRQSKKLHLPLKEARALDLQATIFTKQGNGEKALELLMTSLAIKKKINDSSGGTSFTYSSIGKIYDGAGDFNNAKENYTNAANWLSKPYEIFKCASYTDIGNLFIRANIMDSAIWYVKYALQFNPDYFAALLLMGDIEYKRLNYQKALINYRAALASGSRGTPGTALFNNAVEVYNKIAGVFDMLQLNDSAYYYARYAFAMARQVNNPSAIISSSSALVDLFGKDKNYDSGFIYQLLLMRKKDSLFTIEKDRQIHNVYFNERLQQQELQARSEKSAAQLKIYLLFGLAILVVLLAIGYRLILKNRFHKQLAEIEMRALRAQMNPHFIFNCLASINRYIVKSDTKTASAYLTKFSKLIRLILDNSANELISIDAEIQTLRLYMDMELLRFDKSFDYEIQYDQLSRTDNTAMPAMIIQPYVENAIWHGLMQKTDVLNGNEKKGKLWLRFLPHTEDLMKIEIEDNGIGRKKGAAFRKTDMIKTKSYGMQISKDRIELINDQYNVRSSVTVIDLFGEAGEATGTKVILYLPLIEMTVPSGSVNRLL